MRWNMPRNCDNCRCTRTACERTRPMRGRKSAGSSCTRLSSMLSSSLPSRSAIWPTASANWSTMASSMDMAVGKRLPDSMARRLCSTECAGVRRALISSRSVMTKRTRTSDWPICENSCCRSGTTPTISWPSTSSRMCSSAPEQRLARQFGHRRVLRQPDAAAGVGERQMHPGPAGVIGERLRDRVIGDERGRAIGLEMIGPDDAGFRRCGRGIGVAGAVHGHGALPRSRSIGLRVGASHMTG